MQMTVLLFQVPRIKNSKTNCVFQQAAVNNVDQSNIEFKISISPNPATEKFTLSINSSSKQEIKFFVMDVYGKIVYSANVSVKKLYQFGEHFTPGVYLLKCTQDNISKTYKIVKQ